jgi:transcriptional regulator with PAS, ATPase and Fis domain
MTNSALKIIGDQEKKIVYLENELKSILGLLEILVSGNTEKAKATLLEHKEDNVVLTLNKLIEKFSSASSYLPKQDEKTDLFLKIIIESMPFPVFLKDENARYIYVNSHEANLFKLKESEILGKHDSEFVMSQEEMDIIKKSDEDVLLHNKTIELPSQNFTIANETYIFKTHKIPFVNPFTGRSNILGFSVDVTDTVSLDKLKRILVFNSNPYL